MKPSPRRLPSPLTFRPRLLMAILPAVALVSGCGEGGRVNPPTEPAQAVATPEAPMGSPSPSDSMAPMMPGAGPTSFVGRWTPDVSWCAAPNGVQTPIEITPIRFEAPDASCHIYAIDETAAGYAATLQCQPRGQISGQAQTTTERVQMAVSGQVLTLHYLDRGVSGRVERLLKCTTLTETSTKAPTLPIPGK